MDWRHLQYAWPAPLPEGDLHGRSGKCSRRVLPKVREAFNNMRFIVTVGWTCYPRGVFFGYLLGTVDLETPLLQDFPVL